MNNTITFFIDFDSTFIQAESLDILSSIVLEHHPKKDLLIQKIKEITVLGMEGKISFPESLSLRMALFSPTKYHLKVLTERLKKLVSPSFEKNKAFFVRHTNCVYIISSGFKNYITPVVEEFGILEDHILANELFFDKNGANATYNREHPLAQEAGKVKMLQKFKKNSLWYMIGDGYTDYEVRKAGVADKFFAYTENIARKNIMEKADDIACSFDDIRISL